MANRIIELLRVDDLLVLEFEFINLDLFDAEGALPVRFMRLDAAQPAFIIVRFPPQHLVEQDFHEAQNTADPLAPPPIASRIAGRSRLAFRLPDRLEFIPYSVAALLDWSEWEPSVAPRALPPDGGGGIGLLPPIAAPPPEQTAIELPYRLILSPHAGLGWTHAPRVVTRAGRTELWHTRLGVRRDGHIDEVANPEQRTVRAIWALDLDPSAGPPLDTLPSASDRPAIVHLTSDFSLSKVVFVNNRPIGTEPYTPQPINVNRMMLSSLGGWLDVEANWEPLPTTELPDVEFNIEAWRHIAAMGRNQFVRVVRPGWGYPFGPRVSRVTELERKYEQAPDGSLNFGAYVRRHDYVVLRRPDVEYPPERFPHQGREMPLRSVRVETLTTPFLDDPRAPANVIINGPDDARAFWIRVDGREFPFHIRGDDVEGGQVEFPAAMIFVPLDATAAEVATVKAAYDALQEDRRRSPLNGQRMAYAQHVPGLPGETALTTTNLFFETIVPSVRGVDQAPFVPQLNKADVRIPSLEQILNGPQPVTIQIHQAYKASGLDGPANQSHVFVSALGKLPLSFPSDRSGGLAAPSMDITGISQSLGAVAGTLSNLDSGVFNPSDFFGRADATLLGGVKLSELIGANFDPRQFPKAVTQRTPTSIVTTLDWKPQLKSARGVVVTDGTTLEVITRIERQIGGAAEPITSVTGAMRKFAINFADVALVNFEELSFRSRSGEKVDFSAQLDAANALEFEGELAFINALRRFIPSGGFSDPPAIVLDQSHVEVGYTLALPPLSIGVFALQNVSLGAALILPFTGDPARLRFSFAERHAPFLLTVSLFGGGGFFGLVVGADKAVLVEAALEFGGAVALNLGVASGGVYVMAGIYFKLEADKAQLAGYLRCGGSLEVLGLICISVEFYLEFSYEAGKARGLARVTVKVEVACFSKSVTLTVEKSFGSSAGDPTFGQLIGPDDWTEYAHAFA